MVLEIVAQPLLACIKKITIPPIWLIFNKLSTLLWIYATLLWQVVSTNTSDWQPDDSLASLSNIPVNLYVLFVGLVTGTEHRFSETITYSNYVLQVITI